MDFKDTKTCHNLLDFIKALNYNFKSLVIPNPSFHVIFSEIIQLAQNEPLLPNARFGNKAFACFYDKLQSLLKQTTFSLFSFVDSLTVPSKLEYLQVHPSDCTEFDDILIYLLNSFGNPVRIDFGSGHELNFICFLYCLDQQQKQKSAVIDMSYYCNMYYCYLYVSRFVISKFNMEVFLC